MGKLLRSKRNITTSGKAIVAANSQPKFSAFSSQHQQRLAGAESFAKTRITPSRGFCPTAFANQPVLLTSIKNQNIEFAAFARPGFAMRTATRAASGAGRAYGRTSRLARKGFSAVRARIPTGIKRRIRGIARKAVAGIGRIRRPMGMPRVGLR